MSKSEKRIAEKTWMNRALAAEADLTKERGLTQAQRTDAVAAAFDRAEAAESLLSKEIAERDAAQRECSRLREELRRAEADRDAAKNLERAAVLSEAKYRKCAERAEARVAALEAEARRYYLADGTFEVLSSAAEVVERRKAAARDLADRGALAARVEALAEDLSSWAAHWRRMIRGEEGVWSEDARRALLVSVVAIERGYLEPLRALLSSTPAPQTAEQGTDLGWCRLGGHPANELCVANHPDRVTPPSASPDRKEQP